MQLSLNDIFNHITPQNLNNIPLIKLCKGIFIQNLDANSKVAKRITEIFNIEDKKGDTAGQQRAKHNLRMALYNTYIYTLWKYTQAVANDPTLREELVRYGYTTSALYNDVETIINSEFVQSWHEFTQRVGNYTATHYLYAFARYLETGELEDDLVISEVNPFIFHYEGALGRSIYNRFMKDQIHPAGWLDFYETVFQLILHDYCGVEILDAYTQIELNCNEKYVVFSDSEEKQQIINQFLDRLNPVTMQPYTEEEIAQLISVIPNKVVSTFRRFIDDDNHIINVFVFDDQTVLQHDETDPRHTYYSDYADYLIGFRDPILEWDACWKLSYEQQTNFRFLYSDYHELMKDQFISMIKEDSGGLAAYSCFNSLNPLGMFRVCGHEMQHVQGVDEAFNNVDTDKVSEEIIQNVYKKFIGTLEFYLVTTSDVAIEDTYGNRILWHYLPRGPGRVEINTHSLVGNEYVAWIDDYVYPRYQIWATGLNNFKRRCQIRDLSLYYATATFSGVILDENYHEGTKQLKWEMLQRKPFKNLECYLEFDWDVDGIKTFKYYDINASDSFTFKFVLPTDQTQREGTLHIKLYRSNTNRLVQHEYYGISNVQLFDKLRPNVSCIKYKNIWTSWNEQVHVEIDSEHLESINDPSEMIWYDDYSPDAPARIAERPDGTFYKPYRYRQEALMIGEDLVGQVVEGKLVQGVAYKDSFWPSWKDDLVFIYLGFLRECYLTSDVYLTDSPLFCTDGDYGAWGEDVFGPVPGGETDGSTGGNTGVGDSTQGGLIIDTVFGDMGNYLYTTGEPPKYLFSFDDYYLYTTKADVFIPKVTVFLDLDGGYGKPSVQVNKGIMHQYCLDAFAVPTKHGYQFTYWSLEPGGKAIEAVYSYNHDQTIYAIYQIDDITLTMDSDAGTFDVTD